MNIVDCSGGFYYWNSLDHAWNYTEPHDDALNALRYATGFITLDKTKSVPFMVDRPGTIKKEKEKTVNTIFKHKDVVRNLWDPFKKDIDRNDILFNKYNTKEKEKTIKDVDRIVITKNDLNEVLLRAYSGDEIVEKTIAKCSPDDIFDFNIGAKLAVDRLYEGYDMTPKSKRKPYNGKIFVRAEKEVITFFSDFGKGKTEYVHDRENKIWEVKDGKIVNMIGRALDTIYDDMTDEELSKLLTRSNSFYVGYYYNIVDGYFVR